MGLINGPCSFVKKHTHSIISGIEKAEAVWVVSLGWGQHTHINQQKWNSPRQTSSSTPNWTICHIAMVPLLLCCSTSSFSCQKSARVNRSCRSPCLRTGLKQRLQTSTFKNEAIVSGWEETPMKK